MATFFTKTGALTRGGWSPGLPVIPARRGHLGAPTATPPPATAEELTRDLAGWGLPPAAPLGRAGATWLW